MDGRGFTELVRNAATGSHFSAVDEGIVHPQETRTLSICRRFETLNSTSHLEVRT
jgi:hypothetical protein